MLLLRLQLGGGYRVFLLRSGVPMPWLQSTRDKSKLGIMGAGGVGVTDQALTYLDGSLPGE